MIKNDPFLKRTHVACVADARVIFRRMSNLNNIGHAQDELLKLLARSLAQVLLSLQTIHAPEKEGGCTQATQSSLANQSQALRALLYVRNQAF